MKKKKAVGKKTKKAARKTAKGKAAPKKKKAAGAPKKGAKRAAKSAGRAKAIDFGELTLRQAVARLIEHLEEVGYEPVLTGSACAAVYVGPSLKPTAINFVIDEYTASEIEQAMRKLGFARSSMNHYESKKAPFDVVFSPPPLAVGDDVVKDIVTVQARPGKFKMLNPTDCVRQRLSMFYRWGDVEAFGEAVEVARRHEIDMELVRRWSEWEWCADKYAEFVSALEKAGRA